MSIIICKNCDFEFEGNYCSQCGQKSKTARLNWTYLSDEAKYTFLHLNGGLLFTISQLFKRPGYAIREFVEGKRVNYYKPVLLLFVTAGFYGLLAHNLDFAMMIDAATSGKSMEPEQKEMNRLIISGLEWYIAHYSIMEIMMLPVISLFTWISFKGWNYNYVEHVILNAFSASQRLIITIVVFPLTWYYNGTTFGKILNVLVGLTTFSVGIWTFIQFFKGRDLGMIILRYLLYLFLLMILVAGLIVPASIYFIITHGGVKAFTA